MTQNMDALATVASAPADEPGWNQRAVERSTRAAKLRAEQRVQRFLDAAQAIIAEKGSTDFTVQEVVDRSRQSLRSFYQHFDGKHELLLALFEDALLSATAAIAAAVSGQDNAEAGQLRAGTEPRRAAAVTMETVMFVARSPHPSAGGRAWTAAQLFREQMPAEPGER